MRSLFLDAALLDAGCGQRPDRLRCQPDVTRRHLAGAPPPPSAERLRGVAVPGMPNLHSHAPQRALPAWANVRAATLTASGAGGRRWYRAVGRTGPDQLQAAATQLYVEMLKAGYPRWPSVATCIMYIDGQPAPIPAEMSHRLIAAARQAGIRLLLLPVLYASGGFGGAPPMPAQRRFLNGLVRISRYYARATARRDSRPAGRRDRRGTAFASCGARWRCCANWCGRRRRGADPYPRRRAAARSRGLHWRAMQQQPGADCWFDSVAVDPRWCLIHAPPASMPARSMPLPGLARSSDSIAPLTRGEFGRRGSELRRHAYAAAGGCFRYRPGQPHLDQSGWKSCAGWNAAQRLVSQRRAAHGRAGRTGRSGENSGRGGTGRRRPCLRQRGLAVGRGSD